MAIFVCVCRQERGGKEKTTQLAMVTIRPANNTNKRDVNTYHFP